MEKERFVSLDLLEESFQTCLEIYYAQVSRIALFFKFFNLLKSEKIWVQITFIFLITVFILFADEIVYDF